jgi:transposase-like protein
MAAPRTDITDEQKREAVSRVESGDSLTEVAEAYGVSAVTVSNWRKKLSGASSPRPTRTAPPKGSEAGADVVRSFAKTPKRATKKGPAKKAVTSSELALDEVETVIASWGVPYGVGRAIEVLSRRVDGDGIRHAIRLLEAEVAGR